MNYKDNFVIKKVLDHAFFNKLFGNKIIHVEIPHFKSNELMNHSKRYHPKCYCICPDNYDYVKSQFGMNMSKLEFEKFLIRHYSKLKEVGADLQLHVHLSQYPKYLTFKEKEDLILGAFNFFKKKLKINPTEIVFGWYASDNESRGIANKLGLRVISRHFHIYDFWM